MIEQVDMESVTVDSRVRAIVCFGPATPVTGLRQGEYFQVVIDPAMASPGGEYIRFDSRQRVDGTNDENEIHGWQRIGALTICEMLHKFEPVEGVEPIQMMAVTKE